MHARSRLWSVDTVVDRIGTLNDGVPNCYITLEFIPITLRVQHPSVERALTNLLNVDLV